jgi:hypothetical protein
MKPRFVVLALMFVAGSAAGRAQQPEPGSLNTAGIDRALGMPGQLQGDVYRGRHAARSESLGERRTIDATQRVSGRVAGGRRICAPGGRWTPASTLPALGAATRLSTGITVSRAVADLAAAEPGGEPRFQ